MADGSYTALGSLKSMTSDKAFASDVAVPTPVELVTGLRSFASGHGGATAAIEYLGRKGARIVLLGSDGEPGSDLFADSTEAARAACAKAGVNLENEWERELVEQMRPSNDLWRSMGRRVFSR